MRTVVAAALALFFCGCTYEPAPVRQSAKAQPDQSPAADASAPESATAAAGEAAPAAETPPPRRSGTILGERTREVIELQQALAAGYEVSRERLAEGLDPLTEIGTIAVRAGSVAGSAQVKSWIQQQKAAEGRFPTHSELVRWIQQNPSFELPARYVYEKYAYDAAKGEFVIVDNRQLKEEYLRERGVK